MTAVAGRKAEGVTAWGRHLLRALLRRSADKSFSAIAKEIKGRRVLDIGAAEGWVGESVARRQRRNVHLVDVVVLNETALPFCRYDGETLPFADGSFDTVLVMLVLHHCRSPERVLSEAVRVARRRLIITESTYRFHGGRLLLWTMDSAVNSWRSGSVMPEALHFKTVGQWLRLFRLQGLTLRKQYYLSKGLHRHVAFVLDKNGC